MRHYVAEFENCNPVNTLDKSVWVELTHVYQKQLEELETKIDEDYSLIRGLRKRQSFMLNCMRPTREVEEEIDNISMECSRLGKEIDNLNRQLNSLHSTYSQFIRYGITDKRFRENVLCIHLFIFNGGI